MESKLKVEFKDSHKRKLVGILSNPIESNKIIVMCHGFSSGKDSRTYKRLEKELNSKGFATLRFDFFGHGESEGNFSDITLTKAIDGAFAALDFVKGKGFETIGLFGSSFGGITSQVVASKNPGIKCLALKSPVSDYLGVIILDIGEHRLDDWKKNGFIDYHNQYKLKYSFYEDAKKYNSDDFAEKINVPTLFVHGDIDKIVPLKQSIETSKKIEGAKLEIIKGADHIYNKGFEKMIKLVSDFFVKQIG
ncbi:MAG: 2-succinyl-6-hydroxy-2,4-cyclohexadiene-1-carboxylate synthase [Candidatus Woesearchaeota archaeon]|nr:2-succinyl-6-hydroxy-2,4-cyclohexadiene-1-carboxylate synthase [Candidatus Woesearchaeota archaeon]